VCDKIASSDRAEVDNIENNCCRDDNSGQQHAVTSGNSSEWKDSFDGSAVSKTVVAETRQTRRLRSLVRVMAGRQWAKEDEEGITNDTEYASATAGRQAERSSAGEVFNSSKQWAKEDEDVTNIDDDDDGKGACEVAKRPAEHSREVFNSPKRQSLHPDRESRIQLIRDSHKNNSAARKQWPKEDVTGTSDDNDRREACGIAKRPTERRSAGEVVVSECHDEHSDRERCPQLIRDSRHKTVSATRATARDILELIDVASSAQRRQHVRGDEHRTGGIERSLGTMVSVNEAACEQVSVMKSTTSSTAGVNSGNRSLQLAESETTSQPLVVNDDYANTLKSQRRSMQNAHSDSANNNCSPKQNMTQTRLSTPGRAGNLRQRQTLPGRSGTLKQTTPGRTNAFRPTTSGRSDNVVRTTPGCTNNFRPTTPGRTGKLVHTTPGHAGTWKRTTPGRCGNFRQSTPGRTGKLACTTPGRSDNLRQITPRRTLGCDGRKSGASEGGSVTPAGSSSSSLRGGLVMRDNTIISVSSSPAVKRNAKGETELHRAAIKVRRFSIHAIVAV